MKRISREAKLALVSFAMATVHEIVVPISLQVYPAG